MALQSDNCLCVACVPRSDSPCAKPGILKYWAWIVRLPRCATLAKRIMYSFSDHLEFLDRQLDDPTQTPKHKCYSCCNLLFWFISPIAGMAWQHHATDGRTDSRPPSVLLLGPPSLTHSFARSLAFYRVREHNNFLRLSEKTKVDIYDDGMSDVRAGGMRSTRRRWLGLVLRRNECRVELWRSGEAQVCSIQVFLSSYNWQYLDQQLANYGVG